MYESWLISVRNLPYITRVGARSCKSHDQYVGTAIMKMDGLERELTETTAFLRLVLRLRRSHTLSMNMCRPRKWGKRLFIARSCFSLNWQTLLESKNMTVVDIHCLRRSSTISVQCPHAEIWFYFQTQNKVMYADHVKRSTDAAETFKLCRAHSNHQPSTSTRCGRPCYRKAYTRFLSETTHLHSHISALFTSK